MPGVCRYCHCTMENPRKVYPYGDDDTCGWLPETMQTVCSHPDCARAWGREQRAAKAAVAEAVRRSKRKHGDKYVGWAYGAIVADMRRQQRRKRRGKGRAA